MIQRLTALIPLVAEPNMTVVEFTMLEQKQVYILLTNAHIIHHMCPGMPDSYFSTNNDINSDSINNNR